MWSFKNINFLTRNISQRTHTRRKSRRKKRPARNLRQFSSQPSIHRQKKSDNLGALDLSVYVLHLVTVATNVFTHTRSSCTWCGVLKSAPWLQVIYTLSHSIRYRVFKKKYRLLFCFFPKHLENCFSAFFNSPAFAKISKNIGWSY